jgi:SAM-dependent methyltransferase
MKVCLQCQNLFSSADWTCPSCGYRPERLNGIEAHAPEFAHGGGGFKPEYFAELAGLEATNFWFQARNQLIIWALRTYAPNLRNFLEIGCGTGFVLSGIAKGHPEVALSGSEIFLAGLPHAARRVPSAHFMQMDARHVPFVDEFDAIGAFDVLEHIEEDETALAQLYKALKPGGILLLTVPQHPWLWSSVDDYACHERRYSAADILTKVQSAGCEVLKSTSFVTALLPAMMVSRFFQKDASDRNIDPAAELKIPPWLNTLFRGVLFAEFALIKMGASFPLGGSRLVVAQKGAN